MTRGTLTMMLLAALALVGCSKSDNKTEPQWVRQQHSPHAEIALVFVHGIFGDTLSTWGEGDKSFFRLLDHHPTIGPKVDMYAFGYTSEMLGEGSLGIDEAANMLQARLSQAGVLDYPAVVFINHSMGGLVVMQMLLDHRQKFRAVPAVVLFSTPQSGAEIANIAQHISSNEALLGLIPGDRNAYIRILNDRWKALDPAQRPPVHCAYEKIDTGPIRIVDWASATRFCDGPALAIAANHIDIVKPESAASDSFLVVENVLRPIVGKSFKPKLATPDFVVENDQASIIIDNPSGTQTVRIQNLGGGALRYSLDQWPNGLHVWPRAGEHTLAAEQTETLEIALVWGAAETEYRFMLRSNVADAQPVRVLVKNLESIQDNRQALALDALNALNRTLGDPATRSALTNVSAQQASTRIAQVVRSVVTMNDPQLGAVGQWVVAAELLANVNWPEFSVAALREAQKTEPQVIVSPSVSVLAGNVAALSGQSLEGAATPSLDLLTEWTARSRTPFTSDRLLQSAATVSDRMKRIPALKPSGLSLEGDIARARGKTDQAIRSYKDLAILRGSPLNNFRMKTLKNVLEERPIA